MSSVPFLVISKILSEKNKSYKGKIPSDKKLNGGRNLDSDCTLDFSLEEFLYSHIIESEKLYSYVDSLGQAIQAVNREDEVVSLRNIQDTLGKYTNLREDISNIEKEFESKGFHIGNSKEKTGVCRAVLVEDGRGFGGYGVYSYNYGEKYPEIDGIVFDEELMEKYPGNVFETKYNEWHENNMNIYEEEKELCAQLEKEEKRFTIFGRKEKDANIKVMKDKLFYLRATIKEGENYLSKSQTFTNLLINHKELLDAYLEKYRSLYELGSEASKLIDDHILMEKGYDASFYERDVFSRALSRLEHDEGKKKEREEFENTIMSIISEHVVDGKIMEDGYSRGEQSYRLNNVSTKYVPYAAYTIIHQVLSDNNIEVVSSKNNSLKK